MKGVVARAIVNEEEFGTVSTGEVSEDVIDFLVKNRERFGFIITSDN